MGDFLKFYAAMALVVAYAAGEPNPKYISKGEARVAIAVAWPITVWVIFSKFGAAAKAGGDTE